MADIRSLESRLVLTADPGPMLAGINRASSGIRQLGNLVGMFGGGFGGFMGIGMIGQAFRSLGESFDEVRNLSHQYSGLAAGANALAAVAELRRDLAIGQSGGVRVASYELARERMAVEQGARMTSAPMSATVGDIFGLSATASGNAFDYAASRFASPSAGMNVVNPGGGFIIDLVSGLMGQAEAATESTELLREILAEQRKANATGGGG